jgi:hypothetical protein
MQQPPKKKLLTPKRVNQIADSLDYVSQMKNAAGVKSVTDEPDSDKAYTIAKALWADADANKKNAARYRRLALKAMKK